MVKVFEIIVKHLVNVPEFLRESGGDIIEKGIFLTNKVELVRWLQAAGHKINNVLDYADDGEDNDSQPTITELIWKGIEKVADKIDDVGDLVDNLKDDDSFTGATEIVHKIRNIGTEKEVVELVEEPVKDEVQKASVEFVQLSELENMFRYYSEKLEKKFATIEQVNNANNDLAQLMNNKIDVVKSLTTDIQPCVETAEIKKSIDDIRKKVKVLHKTSKDLDSRITKLENPPELEDDEQTFDDSNDPTQLLAEPELEEKPVTIPEPVKPKPKKTDKEEINKELLNKVEKIAEG